MITKEEVLEDMQRVYEQQGELTSAIYNEYGEYSASTAANKVGSWREAKERIIYPEGKRQAIIDDIQRQNERVEGKITETKYDDMGEFGIAVVRSTFGSWKEAQRAAGIEPRARGAKKISREKIAEDVRRVAKQYEDGTRLEVYEEHGKFAVATVMSAFGSWLEALDELGIERGEIEGRSGPRISAGQIIDDMLRVLEEEGRLTIEMYDEKGKYSASTVTRRLGSWGDAKGIVKSIQD